MKLSIFQSDKGDCFLLHGKDGKVVLCDGGMGPSMRDHAAAELAKLRAKKKDLELIYVSHIDNDHIAGIMQLLENEATWRVFDFKKKKGDSVNQPTVPRPPKIKGILHNGFSDQIAANSKSIDSLSNAYQAEGLLSSMAPSLFAMNTMETIHIAEEMQNLALGIKESIGVGRLVADDALDIPLNRPPGVAKGGKLLRVGRPGDLFKIGGMTFTLLGPTTDELTKLRDGWQNYLKSSTGKDEVRKILAKIKKQVDDFSNGTLASSPFDLGGWQGIPNFKNVTIPNIASIMFMVEENTKRLLLTGDAQQEFILKGLETKKFMPKEGALHIDVLKVQHHGSEHNMDVEFARRVSADHYVFGANGEHENPDLGVLKILFESRRGEKKVLAADPKAKSRPFHWWFSTTSAAQAGKKHQKYFKRVEDEVQKFVAKSNGKLKAHFNTGSFTDLKV